MDQGMLGDEVPIELKIDPCAKRPNILMLFSDEHNAALSGFAGHGIVRTPNLDKLAAGGVVFDEAYCNSPLCSPSRQSFMAGLHAHKIGCWNNTAAMPEDTVTWAHMLSLGGYETSLLGKMHFNGYQKMYGFDRRPVLEANNAGETFYSYGVRTSHLWTDPLPYSDGGGGKYRGFDKAGEDTPERLPIFRHDLKVLQGTLDILAEKAAAGPNAQPWAICSSFVLPHPPWKARGDILKHYRGKGDLPHNHKGLGRDTCDRYTQQYTGNLMDLPEDIIRNAREVYFALIEEFDEYAGRILDLLAQTGLDENTVVFYFSDHGEMAGEHGLWSKCTLLESSVRVPIIISWKGRYQPARVAAPVSLVDLYPTFLELAGLTMPPPLELSGHSLLPLVEGRSGDFAGGEVFGDFEGEGWNHPRAFLREGRYKFVYNHTAESRLYDLQTDRGEMTDLSGRPELAAVEARLRGKLLGQFNAERIEREVLAGQVRRQIARCKNVCKDLGW